MKRVEIEFIKGNEDWRERRIFEAESVNLKAGEYIYIQSSKDGEFYCSFTEARICWISIEPIEVGASELDKRLLQEMGGLTNGYSQIISAIKLYREITGKGLKEAKDYCDALREKARKNPPN
jgi:hypothetical protein